MAVVAYLVLLRFAVIPLYLRSQPLNLVPVHLRRGWKQNRAETGNLFRAAKLIAV